MKVSVIISNRNDTHFLAVTIRSALEELKAVPGGGEVIIVDNSDAEYKQAVRHVIPGGYLGKEVKLYFQDYPCLFTARETAARKASGQYILCVDSHNLFGRDSIIKAVHFMNRHKEKTLGFGSLPVNWLCQHARHSKHDMLHLHGTWGKLYDTERRISWKGQPWICNRDWFLEKLGGYGCFSANKLCWGGGDMYLGVKSWLLGYENWAIPAAPVIHLGPLPVAARKFCTYRKYGKSGEHEAMIGWPMAFFAFGCKRDFFERAEIEGFLNQRIGKHFKDLLPKAARLAADDRKRIEHDGYYNYYALEKVRPWAYNDSYPTYLQTYQACFNAQKSIKHDDWQLLCELYQRYDIKRVLEFGCGLSSMCWDYMGVKTDSYETDKKYMAGVQALCSNRITFRYWNNHEINNGLKGVYDLAFIDGIDSRIKSIEIAKDITDKIIIHDGYSPPQRAWLADNMQGWGEVKVKSKRARLFIKGGAA